MSGRVSQANWCRAGLQLLRDQGHQALTVENLCKALRKTKGSFYHHFVDIGAFHGALLEAWSEQHTTRPIDLASSEAGARRRGARLERAVRDLDHAVDLAVRAWALHDDQARRAMLRVDERRVAFLAALHKEAGHRSPKLLAELEYAAFVGAQQLREFGNRRSVMLGRAMTRALVLLSRDRRKT